jgi:hypothetical protein
LLRLGEKEAKVEVLAEEVMRNKELLRELLDGVSSPNPRVRFGSVKALRIVSKGDPEMLYSSWEFFVKLLDNENRILKWNALDIIADLTPVDAQGKFDRLFRKFYGYLYDGSLVTAAHVVDNSAKIALAKPELQDEIIRRLLKVEEISLPTEECRNILIGKAVDAFESFCDKIKNKDEVVSFVRRQLNNSRNATRRKAEKFLSKVGE